mgnify:CR=1 FL=1
MKQKKYLYFLEKLLMRYFFSLKLSLKEIKIVTYSQNKFGGNQNKSKVMG